MSWLRARVKCRPNGSADSCAEAKPTDRPKHQVIDQIEAYQVASDPLSPDRRHPAATDLAAASTAAD